jgi:hypothetical protein
MVLLPQRLLFFVYNINQHSFPNDELPENNRVFVF